MRLTAIYLLAALFCVRVGAETAKFNLPRSTPEEQGISSAALSTLVDEAAQKIDALHSIMIVRHGKVVAEGWWTPYSAEQPHILFSLSKSFTSTAVGLAQQEGKLSIDDFVLKYFPEDAPAEPSKNLQALRIRDLLKMSTGENEEFVDKVDYFSADTPATKAFLSHTFAHKPGTLFIYNTAATYMLSAIVQKATGQTTLDYLRPRLFEPLGIENPAWDTSRQGISLGGFGLHLKTEDIAKFGQLLLQRGEWQGKRILSTAWLDLATTKQASNGSDPEGDWDQGYGFQFWMCRHGFFRGDGAFGQFCIVMPQYDTVIAITSGTGDMPGVMNLLWTRLLPELRPAALPADEAAVSALRQKLSKLALPTIKGAASSPVAAKVSDKTFTFPQNPAHIESLSAKFENGTTQLIATMAGQKFLINCGQDAWDKRGQVLSNFGISPVAASGAWTSQDTYTAKLCMNDGPFIYTISLRFADGQLFLEQKANVGFGPQQAFKLTGTEKAAAK